MTSKGMISQPGLTNFLYYQQEHQEGGQDQNPYAERSTCIRYKHIQYFICSPRLTIIHDNDDHLLHPTLTSFLNEQQPIHIDQ